jgi:hypothetical protein
VTAATTLDSSKVSPGCVPYPGGYAYQEGGRDVHDQFDVTLEDADLLGEVELTTNLIIAASEADEHMTTAEIDRILGVRPRAS